MADIVVTDVVNGVLGTDANGNAEWQGTGIFDVLMAAVNKNLESQYKNQRINGADYAMVYSNSIVAVMQQAVDFVLREKLLEAQIEDVEKGIEVKDAQINDIEQDIVLKNEQKKLTYTQRVKVDKETALLGLDQTVKSANSTPELVYTPKYNE